MTSFIISPQYFFMINNNVVEYLFTFIGHLQKTISLASQLMTRLQYLGPSTEHFLLSCPLSMQPGLGLAPTGSNTGIRSAPLTTESPVKVGGSGQASLRKRAVDQTHHLRGVLTSEMNSLLIILQKFRTTGPLSYAQPTVSLQQQIAILIPLLFFPHLKISLLSLPSGQQLEFIPGKVNTVSFTY